jgi:tripartite-type tricarboxylate transporter receptor subunit TctC
MLRRDLIGASLAGLGALYGMPARSQELPAGTVRLVVPYPPGGAADVVARLVAVEMAAAMKRTVITDNRPGADTSIGIRDVLNAPANGLTLLESSITVLTNPALYRPAPWNVHDFVPLAFNAQLPYVLLVPSRTPVDSLEDLVAYAARKKDPMLIGSPGTGGPGQLMMSKLMQATGIKGTFVNYKGQPPILLDLAQNLLEVSLLTVFPGLLSLIRQQRLKPLAVFTDARLPDLPQVPMVKETKFSSATMTAWMGLFARSSTPAPLISRLIQIANDMLAKESVISGVRTLGLLPSRPQAANELARKYAADQQEFEKVIVDNDIRVQ